MIRLWSRERIRKFFSLAHRLLGVSRFACDVSTLGAGSEWTCSLSRNMPHSSQKALRCASSSRSTAHAGSLRLLPRAMSSRSSRSRNMTFARGLRGLGSITEEDASPGCCPMHKRALLSSFDPHHGTRAPNPGRQPPCPRPCRPMTALVEGPLFLASNQRGLIAQTTALRAVQGQERKGEKKKASHRVSPAGNNLYRSEARAYGFPVKRRSTVVLAAACTTTKW